MFRRFWGWGPWARSGKRRKEGTRARCGFAGTWDSTQAVLLGGVCVGPSNPGRGLFLWAETVPALTGVPGSPRGLSDMDEGPRLVCARQDSGHQALPDSARSSRSSASLPSRRRTPWRGLRPARLPSSLRVPVVRPWVRLSLPARTRHLPRYEIRLSGLCAPRGGRRPTGRGRPHTGRRGGDCPWTRLGHTGSLGAPWTGDTRSTPRPPGGVSLCSCGRRAGSWCWGRAGRESPVGLGLPEQGLAD